MSHSAVLQFNNPTLAPEYSFPIMQTLGGSSGDASGQVHGTPLGKPGASGSA